MCDEDGVNTIPLSKVTKKSNNKKKIIEFSAHLSTVAFSSIMTGMSFPDPDLTITITQMKNFKKKKKK